MCLNKRSTKGQYDKRRTKTIAATKKLLASQNMSEERDYKIYDTYLPNNRGFISTQEAGFENQDKLIIVHGYAASSAFFFKSIKVLATKFHVYCMDMIGFGCSARHKEEFQTDEDALNYYINSFEGFRQALDLTEFYILGHSLGGLLSAHWVHRVLQKNPNINVKGIYMLSPAGYNEFSPEKKNKTIKRITKDSWFKGGLVKFGMWLVFDRKVNFLSLIFWKSNRGLAQNYFNRGSFTQNDQEKKLMIDYYECLMNYGVENYNVLGHFLIMGGQSKNPLCKISEELLSKYKTAYIYGDKDWMLTDEVKDQIDELGNKYRANFTKVIVKDSAHQVPIENPEQMAKDILKVYEDWN